MKKTTHPASEKLEELCYGKPKDKSIYEGMSKADKQAMASQRLKADNERAERDLMAIDKNKAASRRPFTIKRAMHPCAAGHALCLCHVADESYYLGMGNGKIVRFKPTKSSKSTGETLVAKLDNAILDLKYLPTTDCICALDDTMTISIVKDGKVIWTGKTDIGSEFEHMKVGRYLQASGDKLYYVKNSRDTIVQVNVQTFQQEDIPLHRGKIFDFSVHQGRIFAVSEEGYTISCVHMMKEHMSEDEKVAYPDGVILVEKEIMRFNQKDLELEQKFLKTDLLEVDDGYELIEKFLKDEHGGETQYLNILMSKSKSTKNGDYQIWVNSIFEHAALKVLNYHSIACSEDFVAVVLHDGTGVNCICVYTHALVLKAITLFRVSPGDYSYSITRSIQQTRMIKVGNGNTLIVCCCHKSNTLYVFNYNGDNIKHLKDIEKVHQQTISDICISGSMIATVGRDKQTCLISYDVNLSAAYDDNDLAPSQKQYSHREK